MRKEQFAVGSYVHVYNRGNRKMEITRDTRDKWRFLQACRFFNDTHSSHNILRQLNSLLKLSSHREAESVFELGWPPDWPKKEPLIKILCYCLMPNHFHLLLMEMVKNGISMFMQKLGTGFTNYFNTRYQEVGGLFQGPYKAKVVETQIYLNWLSVYIQVKNVLELFPGGLEAALKNLDQALKFVEKYPFSSYANYSGIRKPSLIIDKDVLGEVFPKPSDYRNFVRDIIKAQNLDQKLGDLKLE